MGNGVESVSIQNGSPKIVTLISASDWAETPKRAEETAIKMMMQKRRREDFIFFLK